MATEGEERQHDLMDTGTGGDALAALRRWEESGGTWRVAVRRPARLELELLTCDGGEVMGRLARRAARPPSCEGYVSRCRKLSRTVRTGLSTLLSTSTTLCQVPSAIRPSSTGTVSDGRDERRQHVVAAVPAAAVPVPVDVVGGQQPVDRVGEVGLAARARLDQRDAGGRVRHEHVQQPVAAAGAEAGRVGGQVGDEGGAAADLQLLAVHLGRQPTGVRPRRSSRGSTRGGRPSTRA